MHSITNGDRQLLNILYYETRPISATDLQISLSKSKRMIYYYIKSVNQLLSLSKMDPIGISSSGYYLTENQKIKVEKILDTSPLVLTPEERVSYLICFLIANNDRVTLDRLAELFDISRNAMLNDLLEVREILHSYQLSLSSTKASGYTVEGDIFRQRSLFQNHLKQLLKTISYKKLTLFEIKAVKDYYAKLRQILLELEIEIEQTEIISLAFLLTSSNMPQSLFNYNFFDYKFVGDSKELATVDKYFPELSNHERIYLAIQILSYNSDYREKMFEDDLSLLDVASELINTFELLSCLKFTNKETLINSVYLHLQLSNYQYHYSLATLNPLTEDIKKKYSDVFKITKVCCDKLKEQFPYPILEDEVAFLTLHFAAFLNKEEKENQVINVLLVCLNSTVSSLLLKNEIEYLFDNINIVSIVKPSIISEYQRHEIDLIISTVELDCEFPVIVVNPILSEKDKSLIATRLMMMNEEEANILIPLKPTLSIIKKAVKDNAVYRKIAEEIENYLAKESSFNTGAIIEKESLALMIKRFGLKLSRNDSPRHDWENAIRECSEKLIVEGIIEPRYVQIMINLIKKYGPYIVISDEIAIAHSQTEDGALDLGVTTQLFPNGLCIKQKKINILFVLSTPNQERHLKILNDIIELSNNKRLLTQLLSMETEEEAKKCLLDFFSKD